MRDITGEIAVAPLLARYDEIGGVLDYVFFNADVSVEGEHLHRELALRGIATFDKRWMKRGFRLSWDEAKLTAEKITLAAFWGTDDAELKPIGHGAWSVPNVDGYKTAFFQPPYGLDASTSEKVELFDKINRWVLGDDPRCAEIYSWSTDWSNYFDAGQEWWGAFYWTVRPLGAAYTVVIGASLTD